MDELEAALEAATAKNPKRVRVETYILNRIEQLDPSGINGKFYHDLFGRMSETMFDKWMHDLRAGKTKLIFWAPNFKVKVRMEDILEIAEDVGLELFEHLRLWDSVTQRYYLTPQKYLVVRLPVRRLKQYLQSKISVPDGDTTVDLFSGQVIKPDKGSAISLVEIQTMQSKNLINTITEYANVRGGNQKQYAIFKSQLEEQGSARLGDLDQNSRVRSAEVVNAYFGALMLQTNF